MIIENSFNRKQSEKKHIILTVRRKICESTSTLNMQSKKGVSIDGVKHVDVHASKERKLNKLFPNSCMYNKNALKLVESIY
jgi:hypothetical protein